MEQLFGLGGKKNETIKYTKQFGNTKKNFRIEEGEVLDIFIRGKNGTAFRKKIKCIEIYGK